ncbi:hypothetical protein ABEB22_18395 (plasmid) [Thioclava sp. 'Guangxiensis']|uniref:hypothetical protein n=1 Tax=Thioclava sp. 'Guangxiensis' TaxID=3149044 RepID=UPI003877DE78
MLIEIVSGLLALIGLLFVGKKWVTQKTKAETEAQHEMQAQIDTLETRQRIEDATRDVPEPDAARDRLRAFGGGADKPPSER